MSRVRRLAAITAVGLTMIGLPIVAAAPASAASSTFEWVYTKNTNDHTDGTLQLLEIFSEPHPTQVVWTVRAGSGNGPNAENSCIKNQGWLPDGTYSITATFHDHDGTVTGPAVELSNKACHDGTERTALFIHSSYPWSTAHYNSDGCIKVSNTGGPSNASGNALTMYEDTVDYHVHTLIVGGD